ncbi:MAG: hypothetical protein J0H44_03170 [Alphaproteobacteria bacterium]|nr:hypothetical protein [Alphaproteobacteria bacterium]
MRVTTLATMALLISTSVAFAQAGGGGVGPSGTGSSGAGGAAGAGTTGSGSAGAPSTTQIPSMPGGATSPPSTLPPLNNTKPNEQMQIGPGGSTTGTGGAKQ